MTIGGVVISMVCIGPGNIFIIFVLVIQCSVFAFGSQILIWIAVVPAFGVVGVSVNVAGFWYGLNTHSHGSSQIFVLVSLSLFNEKQTSPIALMLILIFPISFADLMCILLSPVE